MNKKKILDWMVKRKMNKFEDVSDVVSEYYKSPETLRKKVK